MKLNTRTLAGTAVLAALVVVFDYTLKYANLKIVFPWLIYLKFDFTGVPIVLSLLLYGLIPGAFTSIIAVFAILARSGDVIGASTKGLAEFSTILGVAIGLRLSKRFRFAFSLLSGIVSRVLIMTVVNFALIYSGIIGLPSSYASIPVTFILLVGVFNAIQGALSIVVGYAIYGIIGKRVPSLVKKPD